MGEKEAFLFRKGVKIQDLNRIALPPELLENLNLKKGDKIQIFFDPKDKSLYLKKEKDE